ncbi:MAG: LysR family transcriptional regulator [Deltaproteobacteria bacterium]|nr:MAG: LysR family transcriptional regulator [Deltaproteobacteria bacterium]
MRNLLTEIRLALEPAAFDPAASDRRFTLTVNNYAAVVLTTPVVTAVSAAAAAVRLDLRPSGTLDVVDLLDRGDLDIALGSIEAPGKRFAATLLLEDPFVMVMRRGHPASRRKLSAAAFAALPHLEISSTHEDTTFIDRWLAQEGLARRIALRAPYISAASLLTDSDLVATLSCRFAQHFVRDHPLLQVCKPPYKSPCVRTVMLWHRRLDRHPAHRWLRDVIVAVTKRLESSSSFTTDMGQ